MLFFKFLLYTLSLLEMSVLNVLLIVFFFFRNCNGNRTKCCPVVTNQTPASELSNFFLESKMDSTWSYYHYLWLLNHFTPNIWLLILLTVCHTILLVSVLRIWYWMNWSFPKLIFLFILCTLYNVSTISVWCCTDTVNYVLVNPGS